MQMPNIVQQVGEKVLGVGRVILEADPASDHREEADLLRGQLALDEDRLATLRGQLALLLQCQLDNQEAAARLPAEVESSMKRGKPAQAMRLALELDRIRRELEEDRAEITRLEHAVWCLEFRVRRVERHIWALAEAATE